MPPRLAFNPPYLLPLHTPLQTLGKLLTQHRLFNQSVTRRRVRFASKSKSPLCHVFCISVFAIVSHYDNRLN